jgi:hypothetical protein
MITEYELPGIQSREPLEGHLNDALISESFSAVFRPEVYEPPGIESREPLQGDLLSSTPV